MNTSYLAVQGIIRFRNIIDMQGQTPVSAECGGICLWAPLCSPTFENPADLAQFSPISCHFMAHLHPLDSDDYQ